MSRTGTLAKYNHLRRIEEEWAMPRLPWQIGPVFDPRIEFRGI